MVSQEEHENLWKEITELKLKKESLYIQNGKKISDFIMQLRKDSGYEELIKQIEEKQNYVINIEIIS